MDSLRYWVPEMHVDGFRFDLAAALARELHDVDRLSHLLRPDPAGPVVSQVKLIAEPWDVGAGGYQVGNFPPLWTEWNGKYRDTVRDFWRGEPGTVPRVRLPAHRVHRPVRDERPPPRRLDQLRHLPRRVHPAPTWSPTTTSTTRPTARTTATAPTTTARGTAAPRARPTTPRSTAARPAEAQLPGHPVPVPGRADAAGRRRDRPHPARQQQRLLPGQRDLLGRLVAGRRRAGPAASSSETLAGCAASTRSSAAPVLPRPGPRSGERATSSGSPRPGRR